MSPLRATPPGAAMTLAACLALAGCGSSGTPGSTAATSSSATTASPGGSASGGRVPTACSVLRPAVAKSAIGASAHLTRKAQPNPHETQCSYTSKTGAISLLVGDWSFIHAPGFDGKSLSGIGDEAYLGATELVVRKGSAGMSITAFGQAGEFTGAAATKQQKAQDALEKRIAVKLLPRL